MAKKIFIDGKAGTTGLRIFERLGKRDDVELITIPDELRKDIDARCKAIESADAAFLCLPDDAAREAVSMVENEDVVIKDPEITLFTGSFNDDSNTIHLTWDYQINNHTFQKEHNQNHLVLRLYLYMDHNLTYDQTQVHQF